MNNIDFTTIRETSHSPVSLSPTNDLKVLRSSKRGLSPSFDEYDSSSPANFSPATFSPYTDRDTPSPFKKTKQTKNSIKWLDNAEPSRTTPVSKRIDSIYRIATGSEIISDSENSSCDISRCASVNASELWHNPSLYESNKNQPAEAEIPERATVSLRRSPTATIFKESIEDDDFSALFRSLNVQEDEEESLFF